MSNVFDLLSMMRAQANGLEAKPVPLPNDSMEPIFIVRGIWQAQILYQDLQIAKRLAAGEIGPWYEKHFVVGFGEDNEIGWLLDDKTKATRLPQVFAGHPAVMLFENSKLLKLLRDNGIPALQTLDTPQSVEELRKLTAPLTLQEVSLKLKDMSDEVLDGKLGEICRTRMSSFPIALAWPALVTVAGTLMPGQAARTNLFCALVGPQGCGKSNAIDWALKILNVRDPILLKAKIGSAEGLAATIGDAGDQHRLFYPGELSHLLKKANIEGANFDAVLNDAYYENRNTIVKAKQVKVDFSCQLSVIGGMLEDKFGEMFGMAGGTGLYDRFILGQNPTDAMWEYRPYESEPEESNPLAVRVLPEVWDEKTNWTKHKGLNHRIAEHAIRVATICAGFDGRDTLRADDLRPALALTQYQQRVRLLLKPNPGETFEGKLAMKFIGYLERHEGWVSQRAMYNSTRAYEVGASIADKTLAALAANGEIETSKINDAKVVRRKN